MTNRADETILDLNNQKNKNLRKDKKSKGNKHYLSLGLLVFMVLFVIQFATVLVALAGLVVLVQTGVITVEWIENLNTGRMILLLAAVYTFIGFLVVITATTIPLRPVSNLILQMNRLASGDFRPG